MACSHCIYWSIDIIVNTILETGTEDLIFIYITYYMYIFEKHKMIFYTMKR